MTELERLAAGIKAADRAGNAEDVRTLGAAYRAAQGRPQPNPDGTYGQPPDGTVFNPDTGQMTNRDLLRANAQPSPVSAAAGGYAQGYSMNTLDEGMGAVGGDIRREQFRATMEANREAHPYITGGAEIAGAVLSPVSKALGAGRTIASAAGAAGAVGAIDSGMRAEGSFGERLADAATGGVVGAMTGGAMSMLVKGGAAAVRSLRAQSNKTPSIGALKTIKNKAYLAVRRAGVKFSPDDMTRLSNRVSRLGRTAAHDLDPENDEAAFAAIRVLQRRAGTPINLNNLDKVRQRLWRIYTQSDNGHGGHPFVLNVIDEVDNLIGGNPAMMEAREANSRYAKALLLDNAFEKARRQTSATGGGGNIFNKYKQAVNRIIDGPEARYFAQEEIDMMKRFVLDEGSERFLRRVGKLSPGGNGLMTAITVYGAAVDPTFLGIAATGAAAKYAADSTAKAGAQDLIRSVSTGTVPTLGSVPTRDAAVAAGQTANQFRR